MLTSAYHVLVKEAIPYQEVGIWYNLPVGPPRPPGPVPNSVSGSPAVPYSGSPHRLEARTQTRGVRHLEALLLRRLRSPLDPSRQEEEGLLTLSGRVGETGPSFSSGALLWQVTGSPGLASRPPEGGELKGLGRRLLLGLGPVPQSPRSSTLWQGRDGCLHVHTQWEECLWCGIEGSAQRGAPGIQSRAGRYDGIYRATVEMCLPGEIWPYRFNRGILFSVSHTD